MADAVGVEVEQGMGRTLKDLFSGAVGGVAQVLIGECEASLSPSSFEKSTSVCGYSKPRSCDWGLFAVLRIG